MLHCVLVDVFLSGEARSRVGCERGEHAPSTTNPQNVEECWAPLSPVGATVSTLVCAGGRLERPSSTLYVVHDAQAG